MLMIAFVLLLFGKKINLKEKILINQSISNDNLHDVKKLVSKILKYSFLIELIGTVLIAIAFVPIYGFKLGIFKSLFQSVSAFCNAGFDLVGSQSIIPFATSKIINITCMILITLGGAGFLVWDDISNCIKNGIKERTSVKRIIKRFSLHTKLVLIMQIVLVLVGSILFLGLEFNNTLQGFNLGDKILISTFNSVSSRTAGFATVDYANVTDVTKILFIILMIIGGAPGSTAGGIKTTTLLIIILGVIANVEGKKNISVFKRTIQMETFIKAVSIALLAVIILLLSVMGLIATSGLCTLNVLFEASSAYATVGFTSGALANMNVVSRLIIIVLMYLGRVGTVTMAVAFLVKKHKETDQIVYAKENIIVG